jgi:hypothetical protein
MTSISVGGGHWRVPLGLGPIDRNVRNCASWLARRMYLSAMVSEGTLGKWSLWATHPERLGCIAELDATETSAAARAADLRQAGYKLEIFLSRPHQTAAYRCAQTSQPDSPLSRARLLARLSRWLGHWCLPTCPAKEHAKAATAGDSDRHLAPEVKKRPTPHSRCTVHVDYRGWLGG